MIEQPPHQSTEYTENYLENLFPKLSKDVIRLLEIQIGDFLMSLHTDYTASKRKRMDLTDGDDVLV